MDVILGHRPATQSSVSNMASTTAELETMAQFSVGTVSAGDTTFINNSNLGEPTDMCTTSCEPHLDGTQSADMLQKASSSQTAVTPL